MHREPMLAQALQHGGATGLAPVLVVSLLGALIFVVFAPTSATMVHTWWRSETFAHGFLVVPAVLWLVWQQRAALAQQAVAPSAWAWFALIAVGAVWLLAELASVVGAAQFAVVAMVPLAIVAVLGSGWVRTLAFPLAFLFFAVPFGEVLVPVLIDWTADFTVLALQLTGVPVFREGNHFVVPTGRWSVVEACSGIRYLIASLMIGSLYAWLMYRSTRRRVWFVGLSLLVPLVANWLRAYIIVMLGHLSDNRIATGVDHLLYGWIFFGALMFLLFWLGGRWREDSEPMPAPPIGPIAEVVQASLTLRTIVLSVLLLALLLLSMQAARAWVLQAGVDPRPLQPVPIAEAAGWQSAAEPTRWTPVLEGARALVRQAHQRDGRVVLIHVGLYRNQSNDSKLVTSTNELVRSTNKQWSQLDSAQVATTGLQPAQVLAARVRGPEHDLLVWQWYWLGDFSTTSGARAKLHLALDRLTGRSDGSAWVAIATPIQDDVAAAEAVLRDYLRGMGPALEAALSATTAR